MRIQPKTQQELDEEKLLPAGEYAFTISGAEEKVSKKGNDMIVLTVRVFKPDGSFVLVTDYLTDAMMYKILHLCEAVGLSDKYDSGLLEPEDFIGKEGLLKLKIQKDTTGDYPDKNTIADYAISKDSKPKKKDALSKVIDNEMEDDIPF